MNAVNSPKISFMHAIDQLFFITYLEKQAITKEPENLYEPSHIGIGGKRIRPVLTLMTTEVLMDYKKHCLLPS
jgi:geranylgeranyl diphosphate synthase type II